VVPGSAAGRGAPAGLTLQLFDGLEVHGATPQRVHRVERGPPLDAGIDPSSAVDAERFSGEHGDIGVRHKSGVAILLSLRRQPVAVRRGRHFERVDDTGQESVVVGGHRQLDQPLHVVSILERVERGLVNTVLLD
jgi:hypothetical protein